VGKSEVGKKVIIMAIAEAVKPIIKKFATPDEVKTMDKARIETLRIGGKVFNRITMEPGFSCRVMLDAMGIKDEYCETAHLGVLLCGKLHIQMRDGGEYDVVAGEIVDMPPGHKAWVVGDEKVVILDLKGEEKSA
jgi:hypothetical protein